MWARVKGRAENALLERDFRTWVFRPGLIQPLKGVRSRTTAYRIGYTLVAPVLPVLKRLFPGTVTTTVRVGRAMISAALGGAPGSIVETRDINRLAGEA